MPRAFATIMLRDTWVYNDMLCTSSSVHTSLEIVVLGKLTKLLGAKAQQSLSVDLLVYLVIFSPTAGGGRISQPKRRGKKWRWKRRQGKGKKRHHASSAAPRHDDEGDSQGEPEPWLKYEFSPLHPRTVSLKGWENCEKGRTVHQGYLAIEWCTSTSGRASFWGDAYTVRKWSRNLRTKIQKCVPTKRNGEMNASSNDSAK